MWRREFRAAGTVAQVVKEANGPECVVKMAEGFRLQAELHEASRLSAQRVQESAHGFQPRENPLFIRVEPAVGCGKRADGQRVGPFIADEGQDAEEVAGIFKAFRSGPVRLEDALLHPFSMKVAVGEPVEGLHPCVVVIQPDFQGINSLR